MRRYADNNVAAIKIRKMYEKKFGKKHTLRFDSESEYCYVYTKNREEAEQFVWWSFKDIIEPVLADIRNTNQV